MKVKEPLYSLLGLGLCASPGPEPIFPILLDLPGILIESQRTSLFSSRPRPMCFTRARAHRTTGSLESEETNNICDDNEDAENLCLQEDLKVLKVKGMENFKFY